MDSADSPRVAVWLLLLLQLAGAEMSTASGSTTLASRCGPIAAFWTVPLVDADALSLRITPNETIGSYIVVASRWHERGQVTVYCRHGARSLIGSVHLDPNVANINSSNSLLGGAVVVTNVTRAHIFSWRQVEACLPRNAAFRECAETDAQNGKTRHEYMGYSHASESAFAKTVAFGLVALILLSSLLYIVPRIVQDLRSCYSRCRRGHILTPPDWFESLPNVTTHSPRAIAHADLEAAAATEQQQRPQPSSKNGLHLTPQHVRAEEQAGSTGQQPAAIGSGASKAQEIVKLLMQIADASAEKRREEQLHRLFDAKNSRSSSGGGSGGGGGALVLGTTGNRELDESRELDDESDTALGQSHRHSGGAAAAAVVTGEGASTELLAIAQRVLGSAPLSDEELEEVVAALRASGSSSGSDTD